MDDRNATHTDALALFERLAQEILATPVDEGATHDRAGRLWDLPDDVIHGYYGAVRDAERERLRPTTERLRRRAADMIRTLPEGRSAAEQQAERLADAREHVGFRPWRSDDLARYLAHLDDPAMWTYVPEVYPDPLSEELASSLIEASNGAPQRHEVLAATWDGEVVGQVRLQFDSTPEPDVGETSFWLARSVWGRGYATRFLALHTHDTFRNRPELVKIFAEVQRGNSAAERLLGRIGYRREAFRHRHIAKADRLIDTTIYSIYRNDRTLR